MLNAMLTDTVEQRDTFASAINFRFCFFLLLHAETTLLPTQIHPHTSWTTSIGVWNLRTNANACSFCFSPHFHSMQLTKNKKFKFNCCAVKYVDDVPEMERQSMPRLFKSCLPALCATALCFALPFLFIVIEPLRRHSQPLWAEWRGSEFKFHAGSWCVLNAMKLLCIHWFSAGITISFVFWLLSAACTKRAWNSGRAKCDSGMNWHRPRWRSFIGSFVLRFRRKCELTSACELIGRSQRVSSSSSQCREGTAPTIVMLGWSFSDVCVCFCYRFTIRIYYKLNTLIQSKLCINEEEAGRLMGFEHMFFLFLSSDALARDDAWIQMHVGLPFNWRWAIPRTDISI